MMRARFSDTRVPVGISPLRELLILLFVFGTMNALFQVGLVRQLSATYTLPTLRTASNIIIGLAILSLGLGAWVGRFVRGQGWARRAAMVNVPLILVSLVFLLRTAPGMSATVTDIKALLMVAAPLSLPLLVMGFATAVLYTAVRDRSREHLGTAVAASTLGFCLGYATAPTMAMLLGVNTMFLVTAILSMTAGFRRLPPLLLIIIIIVFPVEDTIEEYRITEHLFWPSGAGTHLYGGWSPYHRVDLYTMGDQCIAGMYNFRQQMYTCPEASMDIPYRRALYERLAPERSVVVIGAGGGMGALSLEAAQNLVLIEIDQVVVDLMKGPFADKNGGLFDRVPVHAMDGRAFLDQENGPFDVIVYEGTDFTVTSVPRSPVEVENYLFTEEGLAAALRSLAADGILLVINSAAMNQTSRIVAALHNVGAVASVWDVSIDKPLSFQAHFITASRDANALSRLDEAVRDTQGAAVVNVTKWLPSQESITDDHPFLYLDTAAPLAPLERLVVMVSALAFLYVVVSGRPFLTYFMLIGNAFILMELYTIVRFRSFFGDPVSTTASVAAVLLTCAALGSLYADHMRRRRLYVLMLLALVVFVHTHVALELIPFHARGTITRILTCITAIGPLGLLMGLYFPLGLRRLRAENIGPAYMLDAVGTVTGLFAFYVLSAKTGFIMSFQIASGLYLIALSLLKR